MIDPLTTNNAIYRDSLTLRHASMKKKFVRANLIPYMTKKLRKAIMKRSKIESKYLKNS